MTDLAHTLDEGEWRKGFYTIEWTGPDGIARSLEFFGEIRDVPNEAGVPVFDARPAVLDEDAYPTFIWR